MITIDGPAGVGKSTVSKCLAGHLHYRYLDTGALYRALALKVEREQFESSNLSHIESLLSHTSLKLIAAQDGFSIQLDGQLVIEKELRTPIISQLASSIAVLPMVREWLLPIQQGIGKTGGVIAEGRDMGTRVFPDAEVKFFFEADVNVRARRRQQELVEKGQPAQLDSVRDEIVMRDARDRTRALDPLRPASDAIVIETSHQSIEYIVNHLMRMIADRL